MSANKEATRELFRAIEAAEDIDVWAAVRDGADLAGISSDGYSVIQKAASCVKARDSIVGFLIGCGADVNLLGDGKDSAISLAVGRDEREICRSLIERGADQDLRASQERLTALGSAAYNGRPELFRYLVEMGGDVHALHLVSGDEVTPLQIAARAGELEIVRYCLQELGMDPECRTKRGRTLVQLASKHLAIKEFVRAHKSELAIQDGIGDGAIDASHKARDSLSL